MDYFKCHIGITDPFGIFALIFGLISLIVAFFTINIVLATILALIPLILGIIAKTRINQNPDKFKGKVLANAGIILSIITLLLVALFLVLLLI